MAAVGCSALFACAYILHAAAAAAVTSAGPAKASLLTRIADTNRGLAADERCRVDVSQLIDELVAAREQSPLDEPGALSGRWRLVYTDSMAALGANKPIWRRPWGDVHQCVDFSAEPFLLQNQEGPPLFTTATAQLRRASAESAEMEATFVEIKACGIFELPIPGDGRYGTVEFAYVDDDLLISRGNRGHVFVLTRTDAAARLPRIRRDGVGYYAGQRYFRGMFERELVPTTADTLSTSERAWQATERDNLTPNLKAAAMATLSTAVLTASFLGANGLLPFQS